MNKTIRGVYFMMIMLKDIDRLDSKAIYSVLEEPWYNSNFFIERNKFIKRYLNGNVE